MMREFERFGQRKLPQIDLQATILVILLNVWANFRDFQQCGHSDGALTLTESFTTRFQSPSSAA
jgi:hypothetical protein